MLRKLAGLLQKLDGQALVEYGFILLLVAMAIVAGVLYLGEGLVVFFTAFVENMQ